MKISFSIQAWEEYLSLQRQDKKTLKKINELIKDIERNDVWKSSIHQTVSIY